VAFDTIGNNATGRMLCAVGIGGLNLMRSFNRLQRTAKFFSFKLPIARGIFILSWLFSGELPTPLQAGASALNGSRALRDGQI